MPNVIRGNTHWCDYGTIIGHELSGHRPALIISRDDVNAQLHVAITIPMSGNPPTARHRRHHVNIADADSWASIRQIRSVEQHNLGDSIAQATSQEMEKILETLLERLATTANRERPGIIYTDSGPQLINKGTAWNVQFSHLDGEPSESPMLLLDYNDGNKLAIAVPLEYGLRFGSPVRVPITVNTSNDAVVHASALVHRIRPIDVSVRTMKKIGTTNQDGLNSANGALLKLLDPKQAP